MPPAGDSGEVLLLAKAENRGDMVGDGGGDLIVEVSMSFGERASHTDNGVVCSAFLLAIR